MTRKQTSDRVSRIAAKLMRRMRFQRREFHVRLDQYVTHDTGITFGDVLAVCASVLDETKGKRKKVRK